MPMPNRNIQDANGYRYAYQGQEKDTETGKEAFELRLWDGRIGRWLTTDPYSEFFSPYLGMGNNPINGFDPNGGFFMPLALQKAYPKLAEFLKHRIQDIANNPKIVHNLKKYGNLTDAQIKKILTWDEGPEIRLRSRFGENGWYYSGEDPTSNILFINKNIADIIENKNKSQTPKEVQAALLLFSSTVLHETTHYGNDMNNKNFPGEEGELFEKAVYGIDIDNLMDAQNVIDQFLLRNIFRNINTNSTREHKIVSPRDFEAH
jgi:RHS repeat-associated protein